MSGNILDFIDGIEAGDLVGAKATFDSMMASKMQDSIDVQRIEVASKFYSDVPVADTEMSEEE